MTQNEQQSYNKNFNRVADSNKNSTANHKFRPPNNFDVTEGVRCRWPNATSTKVPRDESCSKLLKMWRLKFAFSLISVFIVNICTFFLSVFIVNQRMFERFSVSLTSKFIFSLMYNLIILAIRDDRIWTYVLLFPKQIRYLAALHLDSLSPRTYTLFFFSFYFLLLLNSLLKKDYWFVFIF